jgi:hypothetical protein
MNKKNKICIDYSTEKEKEKGVYHQLINTFNDNDVQRKAYSFIRNHITNIIMHDLTHRIYKR